MKMHRTQNDPPFIVALVALHDKVSYFDALKLLKSHDAVEHVQCVEMGYPVIRFVNSVKISNYSYYTNLEKAIGM